MDEQDIRGLMRQLLDLPRLFRRVIRSMPPDVTPLQFVILGALGGAEQPMNMTQLAGEVFVSNQQMTKLVNGLVLKGYAERVVDPGNRRAVPIQISESGRMLLALVSNDLIDIFFPVLNEMSAQECTVLVRTVA
ncbi:MAG: MarR family transcriptional regulator, partial [Oscillospiraceae bacterium]